MADSLLPAGIDTADRYKNYYDTTDYDPTVNRWEEKDKADAEAKAADKSSLSFTDMLGLMVAQFQYQSIDNQADTTDMMNQLVQMSSMQAMTELTTQMQEVVLANVMTYSASLVGKTVTIGIYDEAGKLHDFEGVVEGTGTYNGQQVIFVDGKSYALSSIMAVGKLPPKVEEDDKTEGDGDKTEGTENPDDKVEQTPGTEGEDTTGGETDETVQATQAGSEVG